MNSESRNLYQNVLAVLAIAVFFTNLPPFLFYKGMAVFGTPKMWVLGFVALTAPLLVNRLFEWNLREWPLLLWCTLYIWISLLSYFTASESEVAWQELRLRLQTVLLLFSTLLVFAQPMALQWARKTLVVAVIVGAATTTYELFHPMSLSSSLGRPAGFYLNPNQAGIALVLGMAMCLTVLPERLRSAFVLLTGLGVLATMSRTSVLAWLLTVVICLWKGLLRPKHVAVTGGIGAVLLIALLLPRLDDMLEFLRVIGVWDKDLEERIQWFVNPSIQSSPYSNESSSRLEAAERAWNEFSQSPIWGNGVGTALAMAGGAGNEKELTIGSHNMYLANMIDHGILGVLIFPLAVLAAIWKARGEAKALSLPFTVILLFAAFFIHTILQDTFPLPLFSLMAAMAVLSRRHDWAEGMTAEVSAHPYGNSEREEDKAAWQI